MPGAAGAWRCCGKTTTASTGSGYCGKPLAEPDSTSHPLRTSEKRTDLRNPTANATGTAWIIADGLQSLPEQSMQRPNPLDVAALLDNPWRQYIELQRCDIQPIH